MYNEEYINCFKMQKYNQLLNSIDDLNELAENYCHQYDDSKIINAEQLALKESLDHYVLSKLKTNRDFQYTKEFINYVNYLKKIILNKYTIINEKKANYYLEFNTNIVFSDEQSKNIIANKIGIKLSQINDWIDYNNKLINNIEKKLDSNDKLSQNELDYLGDYLHNKNNRKEDIYPKYIKYVLNNMQHNNNTKLSLYIVSAILTFLQYNYERNSKIENRSRNFIGDIVERDKQGNIIYDKNNIPRCEYNCKSFSLIGICIFGKDFVKDCLHTTKDSLNKHRDSKRKTTIKSDIYLLIWIAFHELTHQYQALKAEEKEYNNIGFAHILFCINNMMYNDYNYNHDTDEIEINADQEGWYLARSFFFEILYRQR